MKDTIMIAAAALFGLTSGAAPAAAAPAAIPDRLAVSDVMSWTVSNDRTVYVEDAAAHWYRVDLAAPCEPLAKAFGIAIKTSRGHRIGTASALVTGGGRCAISAVVPVPGPALPPNGPDAAFASIIGR
jgi:hypothetical protein